MTKEEVKAKIEGYNREIDRLIRERTSLMNQSMPLFAKAQVGDTIYTSDGRYLGVVYRLYRFQANHNPLLDTSMAIDYEFEPHPDGSDIRVLDNTSRQYVEVVTESELKRLQLEQAKRLIAQAELASQG